MIPFSSVAIIEKLALVRIAFCKAPVLSNTSWRRPSRMPSVLPASSRMKESLPFANMAGLCNCCEFGSGSPDQCQLRFRTVKDHCAYPERIFWDIYGNFTNHARRHYPNQVPLHWATPRREFEFVWRLSPRRAAQLTRAALHGQPLRIRMRILLGSRFHSWF